MVSERQRLKSRQEAQRVEVTEAVERGDRRWWVRLRSAGLLAALLAFLGVTVAAVVGVLALAVTVLIDRALG